MWQSIKKNISSDHQTITDKHVFYEYLLGCKNYKLNQAVNSFKEAVFIKSVCMNIGQNVKPVFFIKRKCI